MTRIASKAVFCAFALLLLFPVSGRCQQQPQAAAANTPACPSQPPGVYVRGTGEWQALSPSSPSKTKAKHSFLSSLSEGAVAARIVAEYPGSHAAVQVQGARPEVCISHLLTPNQPMMVRLDEKKKDRELDGGKLRALPVVGQTKQAKAESASVVPTVTENPEDGVVLLQTKADLVPGEYAVMFGPTNFAIFDFGVAAGR